MTEPRPLRDDTEARPAEKESDDYEDLPAPETETKPETAPEDDVEEPSDDVVVETETTETKTETDRTKREGEST